MERLTIEELIDRCDRQMNRLPSGNTFYQEHESVRAYLQMLRHYIATGLTPEQIKDADDFMKENYDMPLERFREGMKLIKAKDAGRLVVLPCKVGDTLYEATEQRGVVGFRIDTFSVGGESLLANAVNQTYYRAMRIFDAGKIGKTVFLTRQEAEAALREEGSDG